jgi:hypothetical protein
VKVKRTSQSSTSTRIQGKKYVGSSADKTAGVERREVQDTVTLSEDALAVAAAEPVAPVEAAGEGRGEGPLPDPRETSRAILEKELASVFREIYL